MIELLFSGEFWYTLLTFAFIAVLVWICVKYKQARVFVYSLFGLAFVALTCYSAIEINYYYTAKGGVFGFIGEKLHTNTVGKLDDYTYSVQNLRMTQNTDGSYSAIIYSNDVVELDSDKVYGVYVNETPVTQISQNQDYLQAEYRYQFYDDNATTLLCDDTLQINFAFYENMTLIKLSTAGGTNTLDGQSTVNYWNSYFAKNSFKLEVKELSFENGSDIGVVEGDVSNYNVVRFYVDNELYEIKVGKTGETVGVSRLWEYNGKSVTSWEYIDGAYYAYTYDALGFEVNGETLTEYTGESTAVLVPKTYTLFRDRYPAVGDDCTITTIGAGCFDSKLETILIQDNITTIESGAFKNSVNLKNVYVESYDVYTQLTSTTACGSILQYSTEVQILASIDDGSNALLSDTSKYTKYTSVFEGKDYNRYVEVINTDDNENVCTVTYYDYYGALVDTQTYNYGDELVFTTEYVEHPEAWTEGSYWCSYQLDGWEDSKGNQLSEGYIVTSDLELQSVWTINKRVVSNPV